MEGGVEGGGGGGWVACFKRKGEMKKERGG